MSDDEIVRSEPEPIEEPPRCEKCGAYEIQGYRCPKCWSQTIHQMKGSLKVAYNAGVAAGAAMAFGLMGMADAINENEYAKWLDEALSEK